MTRSRFFSHHDEGDNGTASGGSAARVPRSTKMTGAGAGNGGTASRWRRPRLRRSHAHDFNEALLADKAHRITPALSGDSLGSGYTEAPSSRGTSTASLSTCSPALGAAEDGALDVEDFDLDGGDELSWLEEDLAPTVVLPATAAAAAVLEEEDEFAVEHKPQRFAGPLVLHVQDFECGECIGKGSYSKVFLGTHALTGTEWALKVVSKRKTFETRENLAHLREERYISTKLQGSDFLVRTAGTFNTTRSVVFAMEYLPGGDLYQRLSDKGTLSLGEAVAWTAQAVLAIEDLHAKNIVHRDVKPENFLMGKSGTLKLTDFGFARELEPDERLYSQFGTPEYVAPEVLNGCGHGMPVDLWALGVLVYELLVGQTPFKSPSVDEMYERIAAGDYSFPAPPPSRTPRSRRAAMPANTNADATTTAAPDGGFAKSSKFASAAPDSGCSSGVEACSGGVSGHKAVVPAAMAEGVSAMRAGTKNISSSSNSNAQQQQQQARREEQVREQQPAQLDKLGQQRKQQPHRSKSNSSTSNPATHRSKYATAPASTSHRNKATSSGALHPPAQSLVNALLCLSPGRRPSIAEVKHHPFFAGVDFEGLRAAVRAQADREEEEAVVAAAIDGDGEVWVRGQPVECVSEDVEDNYGNVFAGF